MLALYNREQMSQHLASITTPRSHLKPMFSYRYTWACHAKSPLLESWHTCLKENFPSILPKKRQQDFKKKTLLNVVTYY